jgi:hypothetical protein
MLDTILDIGTVAGICFIGIFLVSYYRMKDL